jgi:pyruvate,orthophosphate dikinase
MIPLVGILKEFSDQKSIVDRVAADVMKEQRIKIKYLVGTMIEIPRGCTIADQIAREAEFFSFGTNDLTQLTFGFSRDDVGKFLKIYQEKRSSSGTRSRRSTSKALAILCASASNAAARRGPISNSASAASTAATRRRSISSTRSGSITSAPAPTAFRSRGWPRHRRRCL